MSDFNPYHFEPTEENSLAGGFANRDVSEWCEDPRIELAEGLSRGWLGHVPLLGILMLLQGSAEIVRGVYFAAVTTAIPSVLRQLGPTSPLVAVSTVLFYGVATVLFLATGGLHVFASIAVRNYRQRRWALAALSCGLLTCFGGWLCFPTSLCVFSYGFVILWNSPVQVAFRLGAAGYTRQQIEHAFARLPS